MKRIIVLIIICIVTLLGCGKKAEPSAEPVTSTSLTEPSVVSENVSDIQDDVDGIKIDENTFPDEIFRNYVKSEIDRNNDDILSNDEMNRTKIYIDGLYEEKYIDINSLAGIEYFTNLEILICTRCNLTELDVSRNTRLKKINVRSTNLKGLDVSNNIELLELLCGNTDISSLNVSNNRLLVELDIATTNIQDIDVTNNRSLVWLEVSASEISELDLSNNPLLKYLAIRKTNIESLDLSNNSKLERFSCYKASSFKNVDFSNNPMLLSVVCNGSAISKLDLTNNPKCFEVECNKDTEIIGGDNIKYLTRY